MDISSHAKPPSGRIVNQSSGSVTKTSSWFAGSAEVRNVSERLTSGCLQMDDELASLRQRRDGYMKRHAFILVMLVTSVVINVVLAHKPSRVNKLFGIAPMELLKTGVTVPPFQAQD